MPAVLEQTGSETYFKSGYTEYSLVTSYTNKVGDFPIPLSDEGIEIVSIHAPLCFRIVTWQATGSNGDPEIPAPELLGGGGVLVYARITGSVPAPSISGDSRTLAGQYIYSIDAWDETDTLPLGTTPDSEFAASDNTISPELYRNDLLE